MAASATITTDQNASVTGYADGSFDYDPSGSAAIQALDNAGLTDTFTYTITQSPPPLITVFGELDAYAFDVSGVYIQQDYGIFENDIWALSAAYSFGNNKVIATYGQSDVSAFGIDVEELDSYGVAFQHMLSKRTSAYAAYANRSLDEFGGILTAEDDVLSLGMIHKF